MKKIIIAIILTSLLGGSSCMLRYPENNINDVALDYMRQKYGEEFEYYAPFGNSMSGTHQFLVRCDSFPEQNILVSIENYRKDDKIFLDNYLAVKYHDDVVDFLDKCVKNFFEEATVLCNTASLPLPAELSADTSFEDFMADTTVPLHFFVEVKISEFTSKEQIQSLSEELSKYGGRYYLSVLIVDDSDFGTEDIQSFNDRIYYEKYIHCAKSMKLSDEINIRWLGEE